MKNNKSEPIPVMDYRQYRRVRRLVHECCNYIDGNCIALDDGEECVCVQSISYSLQSSEAVRDFVGRGGAVKRVSFAACGKAKDVQLATTRFRAAVLPQDKELETALFHRLNAKKCAAAGRRDIQFFWWFSVANCGFLL